MAFAQADIAATHLKKLDSRRPEFKRSASTPNAELQTRTKRSQNLPPTTYFGSNSQNQNFVDLGSILNSVDSFETKAVYRQTPKEVRQLIERLCRQHHVVCPVWAQSPTDWREIRILGQGATKIQTQLEEEAKTHQFEFKFVTIESGPLHTRQLHELSVVQRTADSSHPQWNAAARASCQLIVSAEDKRSCNSGQRNFFIVTVAHLILSGAQCEEITHSSDCEVINQIRENVDSQFSKTDYILEITNRNGTIEQSINVASPAMLAFRHYYQIDNTDTANPNYLCSARKCTALPLGCCPHMYMNDLALLPIAKGELQRLLWRLRLSRKFQFDGIASAEIDMVKMMVQSRAKVYVDETECEVVPSFESVGGSYGQAYADHLTFIPNINRSSQFLYEGSSGSVVYLKRNAKKYAFAMVVGKLEKVPDHYQAILLQPALRDIAIDYRHHVDDIKLLEG